MTFACLILAAVLPSLGINEGVHARPIEADGRTFPCGITVIGVEADGPAEAAGLRNGDVIVAINGKPLAGPAGEARAEYHARIADAAVGETLELLIYRDGVERTALLDGEPAQPQAWEDPDAFVSPREPNSALVLTVRRTRGLLTLPVTLGPARTKIEAVDLPRNEEIFDGAPPAADFAELIARLVAHFDWGKEQAVLRGRLAELVARGDRFRLTRTAYALRAPAAMPAIAARIAAAPPALSALLLHAARQVDCAPVAPTRIPLRSGFTGPQHLSQIEHVLQNAYRTYVDALANLDDEARELLVEHAATLGEAFDNDVMVQRDPDRRRLQRLTRFVAISQKVDRAQLVAAAMQLAALADDGYLDGLADDLADLTEPLRQDTPIGPIVIAGRGDDWHKEPAAVIVDLGGDDFYTAETQRPLSIIIDLAGDDAYQATFDRAQAAGVLGVALLIDRAGDDRYIGQRWCQGAAVCGVGALVDRAGDDVYRAERYSQGVAYAGVGLLVDEAGDDRYDAPRFAQAFALPGGFAGLIERGGDDAYYCKGRTLGAYGTPGIFSGWGQGCASGLRGLASGGIALLLDEVGDDRYEAGNFAQGGGYYFGWGLLVDRAGDDRYDGERYAQAFAAHQALGYLEDQAGDDRYFGRRDVAQSCAWDQSITMLLERGGNDSYSGGRGFSLAASAHNGYAVLIDYAGEDAYPRHRGRMRSGPNSYHGGTSFSLHADLGGGADRYADDAANGAFRRDGERGVFLDADADRCVDAGPSPQNSPTLQSD